MRLFMLLVLLIGLTVCQASRHNRHLPESIESGESAESGESGESVEGGDTQGSKEHHGKQNKATAALPGESQESGEPLNDDKADGDDLWETFNGSSNDSSANNHDKNPKPMKDATDDFSDEFDFSKLESEENGAPIPLPNPPVSGNPTGPVPPQQPNHLLQAQNQQHQALQPNGLPQGNAPVPHHAQNGVPAPGHPMQLPSEMPPSPPVATANNNNLTLPPPNHQFAVAAKNLTNNNNNVPNVSNPVMPNVGTSPPPANSQQPVMPPPSANSQLPVMPPPSANSQPPVMPPPPANSQPPALPNAIV